MLVLKRNKEQKSILESKQVGTLYHVCNLRSAIYNLKNNCIKPGVTSNIVNDKTTISFTRDKNYIVDTVRSEVFFQFVIDGDKLSEHKKIQPYFDTKSLGYLEPGETEREEIAFGEVKDLISITKEINIFIVDSLVYGKLVIPDPLFYKNFLDSLEYIEKYKIKNEIRVIKSFTNLAKVQSSVPSKVKDLIPVIRDFIHYDNISMIHSIKSMVSHSFEEANILIDSLGIIRTEFYITQLPNLHDYSEEILEIVNLIKEQKNAKSILITEDKLNKNISKRYSSYKLNTLLKNKTYRLVNILISPVFDWLNNTSPYFSLTVMLESNKLKTFYIYFI